MLFYDINRVNCLNDPYDSTVSWYYKLCVKPNKKYDSFAYSRGRGYFHWESFDRSINKTLKQLNTFNSLKHFSSPLYTAICQLT